MSGESDGIQDAVIQDYLNDTDSELSSLSHLDAPSESVYMICGVLIAMLLVGFIIILLAVTIRFKAPARSISCNCWRNFCKFSKLRKREESSGMHRSNVVHPEGVLQATIIGSATPEMGREGGWAGGGTGSKLSPPLEDIFIAPVISANQPRKSLASSENSFSGYSSETTQLPMFLYSTGNSRNSLDSSNNDQDVLVHPSGPSEDLENNNTSNVNNNNQTGNKEESSAAAKKNIKGKLKKLVRKKSPPPESYALPMELREQLKQIYVY